VVASVFTLAFQTAQQSHFNRQCSSALSAVNQIANEIGVDIGIGELILLVYYCGSRPFSSSRRWCRIHDVWLRTLQQPTVEAVLSNQKAQDFLTPKGTTSENVASAFSFLSGSKTNSLPRRSRMQLWAEICPLKAKIVDPKTQQEKVIVVDADDAIRDGITASVVFSKTGSTYQFVVVDISDISSFQ
jgi:acetyl-CoA acyltransferase 1